MPTMSNPAYRDILCLRVAVWIMVLLAIAPLFFPIDWFFHIFSDDHPAIHRMRGLGATPKILWILCGPIAIAAIYFLVRRPVLGFLACVLFAAVSIPVAIVLWAQFTMGCWAALLAVLFAGAGTLIASRAGNAPESTSA
jgi:hypothetical protein